MSIGSGTTKEIGKGNTRRHNHILPPLIFIVKQQGGGRQEDMNKEGDNQSTKLFT